MKNKQKKNFFTEKWSKIGVPILCAVLLILTPKVGYTQTESLKINQNKTVTIDDVFEIIKKRTNYRFIYKADLFKNYPKVKLRKGTITIKNLLNNTISSKDFIINFKERTIEIVKKSKSVQRVKNQIKPQQQEYQVSGKVTDELGEPLPGVSIVIKGTKIGTATDFEGDYILNFTQKNAELEFSFLGMVSQTITYNGQDVLNVALKNDAEQIDDVVIIGYGSQRKKDVAGSISSVKKEDLVLSSTPSIGHVLLGKAAGLQIVQNSAQPGGGLDMLIRGAGSVNASNAPLIVIDGFPITEFQQPDSGNRYDGGTQGILNSFNPNDIENISVLKDASATSIYGARAANGVILITTKKGEAGKISVDYSSSYSIQSYKSKLEVLELSEWMQIRNETAREYWEFVNRVYPYSNRTLEEAIADPVNGIAFSRFYSDYEIKNAGKGTDWLSLVTRDGSILQHNIAVHGGTESTKYYLSANLYEHKGVMKNSSFGRSSLRLNLDQKMNKYLNFGMNLTLSRIKNENSQLGGDQYENSGIIRSALQYGPHIQAIDKYGNYPINPDNALEPNPYSLLTISDEGNIDRTLANFFIEIKPFNGLVARFQGGIDQGNTNRNTYLPRTTLWGALENGKASIASKKKNDNLFDFTLTYSNLLNEKHNLNLLLGYSQQNFKTESNSIGNSDFITDAFLWNNINSGAGTKVVSSSKSKNNLVSYFGRASYTYDNKYIFTTTMRRDGSGNFAKNNKYGFFPSFAIGWNIAEESFMNNLKNTVSQLKFRFSYGKTGNADISGLASAAYYAQPAYLNPDESILIGVFASRLENPDLKWETTTEANIGLDFELFNSRVSGSVEVFNKEISDLLYEKPINSYNEVNKVWANIGSTQSRGIEFTLNTLNIDSEDFKWRSTLTFSKFKDRWKERASDWKPAIYENDTDPIRAQYSYLSDGIMQTGEVVTAQPDLLPGQIKIKDVNGFSRDASGDPQVDENGRFIPTGEPDGIIDEADIVLLGSSDPDFIGGFTNVIEYKNFQLNFHFNGMFGRKIVDQTDFALGVSALGVATNGRNALTSVRDRWTPNNPSTTRPSSFFGFSQYDSGDFFLQDAWFIRLQNLSLSYKLPSSAIGTFLSNVAIRLDAQNLFVITPYKGVDPETDAYAAAYPNVKTFTIGVDLKF